MHARAFVAQNEQEQAIRLVVQEEQRVNKQLEQVRSQEKELKALEHEIGRDRARLEVCPRALGSGRKPTIAP